MLKFEHTEFVGVRLISKKIKLSHIFESRIFFDV